MLQHEEASKEEIDRAGLYYRVFRPENPAPGLIVLVHGRAGDANVKWVFARGLKEPLPVIVAPQAPLEDNIGGYSWWNVSEGSRGGRATKEDLLPPLGKLGHFIRETALMYGARQVVATGFSQGAGIVSTLSLQQPELFSKVGLLAGFIPSVVLENPGEFALSENTVPNYFIAHGTEDKIVPLKAAERARDFLTERGSDVQFITEPVGHKIGAQSMRELREWLV